jgi:hypothetical protein
MVRLLSLVCAFVFLACSTSGTGGQKPGPSREDTAVSQFEAQVVAIDHATRNVTLLDSKGEKLTFRADEGVRNLDQVKVGDKLQGELVENLLIEARAATAEEQAAPVQVAEGLVTAQPGEKPGGLFVRQLKSVFTVASIDKAAGGGELRDATGALHFVKARDPAVLDRLKVGDTVVVTYTEALRLEVVAPGM